jgi:hypothetical protein
MAGIEFKTRWANLDAYVRQGMDPVAIEPRGRDEEWLIAISPVTVEDPVRWALVRDGDALYIPLVPYQVSPEPEKAFRELMGRGMLAGMQVNMTRGPIRAVLMVPGYPVEDLRPEHDLFRFWVGMAVRIK